VAAVVDVVVTVEATGTGAVLRLVQVQVQVSVVVSTLPTLQLVTVLQSAATHTLGLISRVCWKIRTGRLSARK
jgi:hypothetical protein